MKFLSISLLSLLVSGNCFAGLDCGSFPGLAGHRIPGATTYSVKFYSDKAILTVHTFEIRVGSSEEILPKTFQGVDGASFENAEYKVFSANAKTYLVDRRTNTSIQCK